MFKLENTNGYMQCEKNGRTAVMWQAYSPAVAWCNMATFRRKQSNDTMSDVCPDTSVTADVCMLLFRDLSERFSFDIDHESTRESLSLMHSLTPGIPSPIPSSWTCTYHNASYHTAIFKKKRVRSGLKYTDVVAYSFLLILCDALRNPGYVAYLLQAGQPHGSVSSDVCPHTCSLIFTHA